MTNETLEAVIVRYHQVLFQAREPQTFDEDILVKMYQDAIMEIDMFDSYMDIEEPSSGYAILDLLAMVIGYSLGQKNGQYDYETSHIN